MILHVFVCHLEDSLVSSYYSDKAGPPAKLNNTVRRYESLIKNGCNTFRRKQTKRNQGSISVEYIKQNKKTKYLHRYSTRSQSQAYKDDDYSNTS